LDGLTCKPHVGRISGKKVSCDIVECALALYFVYIFIHHIIISKSGFIIRTFGTLTNGL